ncbi:YvcK family protein [uncultured Ilyobacter sp.]|uniref:gluconeogenesis factor YvcK family protein n=1 Tax=uncultured Ilyobacter sp. TaxID=544433 RepID=UPI0029C00165|nr:YvcK family protein [uncultured Ilyobacter sp.]
MYIKPKVVVIGGGTGLSVLLRGLKHFPVEITAIVTVADDGGSSGKLRDEFDMPAPGDLRNVMVALSEVEPLVEELLQYRFKGDSSLGGHPLGNLLLTAMVGVTGDLVSAMKGLRKVFDIRGNILPSTCESVTLLAEMEDGEIIAGESMIPKTHKSIERVFFEKNPKPVKEALEAIEKADLIVLGIGSLYTSIIPNLLIPEMKESLIKSKAKKVYVCNAMQQPGETGGYTVSDHIKAINRHVNGEFLDVVVTDSSEIPKTVMKKYNQEGAGRVEVDFENLEKMKIDILEQKLLEISEKGTVRHHPYRLAGAIYSLVEY